MVNDRYSRSDRPRDYQGDADDSDFNRSNNAGRDYPYSGTSDYRPARALDRDRGDDRGPYGDRASSSAGSYGPRDYGHSGYARRDYGQRDPISDGGSYRSDHASRPDRFSGAQGRTDDNRSRGGYSGADRGQDATDRGFFDRAGDEVRSWFGDEDAERRREMDSRRDARYGTSARDEDYHGWRRAQIDALDRDYDEYRRENRTKFENEFGSWRSERETQRNALARVSEHMEVIGSDGTHVGTVDKVRGDQIILTKSDAAAGSRHHAIPSRWLQTVDDKVTLRKTADEARAHWLDEERNQAMFGEDHDHGLTDTDGNGRILNRSFSGTY